MKSPWLLEYLLNLDVLLACVPCVSLAVRRAMKREREDIIDIRKGSILCGVVSSIVSIRVLLERRWWICPERRSHSRINSERLHSTSPMPLPHLALCLVLVCGDGGFASCMQFGLSWFPRHARHYNIGFPDPVQISIWHWGRFPRPCFKHESETGIDKKRRGHKYYRHGMLMIFISRHLAVQSCCFAINDDRAKDISWEQKCRSNICPPPARNMRGLPVLMTSRNQTQKPRRQVRSRITDPSRTRWGDGRTSTSSNNGERIVYSSCIAMYMQSEYCRPTSISRCLLKRSQVNVSSLCRRRGRKSSLPIVWVLRSISIR